MEKRSFRSVPARLALLALAMLGAALLSLCLGAAAVSPREILSVLSGGGKGTTAASILLYVRLPRTLGCLLAGAALAVSGAVIQTVLANPLAAPNIIGVNSGAGLGVALCCAVLPTAAAAVPFAAFLGAFAGVMLVLLISERRRVPHDAGAGGRGISGMFGAGIDAVLTVFPDSSAIRFPHRRPGQPVHGRSRAVLILLCLGPPRWRLQTRWTCWRWARHGPEPACGARRAWRCWRWRALAGAAVSFAGLLGFVALLRRIWCGGWWAVKAGACWRAALGGAALLTVCDVAARTLFAPYELPVGVVLSRGRAVLPLAAVPQREGTSMIELRKISAGYRGEPVLRDVDLVFPAGCVTVLLGPNGCGKSTLLKTALGLLPALSGEVLYDGAPLSGMPPEQVARRAAYMAQSRNVPSIEARRMVLHGRFPYLSFPRRYRKSDYAAVRRAMEKADALELADRPMQELSGGRGRMYLAMALAQETPAVFMDEPTTFSTCATRWM
ncbi:MAG: iron chelate uptake ABC transporter family permease subunit [Ruthenibacterium lactatiformans]